MVVTEKCTPENAKLSSVKNFFWVNHASKKTRYNPKLKLFEWTNVPENMNWLYVAILENWVRNRQKTPKIA